MRFKIIVTLLSAFLLHSFASIAQHRAVTDKVVAKFMDLYNSGQYSGIYNLYSLQSKGIVSEENLTNFYKVDILQPLGLIKSWKFVDEKNTNAWYTIYFERGKLRLNIACSKDGLITYDEWVPLKQEKVIEHPRAAASIKTNNPKQNLLQLLVDSLSLAYLRDPNNSSLSIGVVNGDKTETYFYGEKTKGTGVLPDASSLYEIASVTKTFTATLLAHAVNEKKVSLNDDIRKYMPGDFPNLEHDGKAISLLNLVNHTSILPQLPADFTSVSGYNAQNPYAHYTKDRIYMYLKTVKLDTVPGSRSLYSNLGAALLGILLENVYQKPLAELVNLYITGPLKMENTVFDVPDNKKNLLVTGYSEQTGQSVPYWQFGAFKACGGLKSNLQDLLSYLKAEISDANPDMLLTHQETDRREDFNRGLGWVIEPFRKNTSIWHNGGTGGFRSWCGFVKDKKIGVVVLSNSNADVDDIAEELLSQLIQSAPKGVRSIPKSANSIPKTVKK